MIGLLDKLRRIVFSVLHLRTLGSGVMAVDPEGNVLLVRHSYGDRRWRLPGGGLKRGETFEQAALREAREEVGLEMAPNGRIDLLDVFYIRLGGWENHSCVYVLRNWTITPKENWEIAGVGHFPMTNLPADTAGFTRRHVAQWLERQQT